jgi:tetratricopeptide (TPR) repeat protein
MRRAFSICLFAVVLVPLSGCNKMQARVELKRGNELYKEEAYRAAMEQFEKGLQIDPGATFAWRSVGLSAMAVYRPGAKSAENDKYAQTAIDAFKKYLADYPNDDKVQEYLMTMLINSERYDDALAMMKQQLQATPNKPGLSQAIVSTLAKAGRLDEAYDWALKQGGTPDPTLFYSIGVACWDKAYYDPMLDSTARGKVVDTGLASTKHSLDMKPDYFEAMAYYNLLFREKAKLELDPAKAQEWIAQAEEWTKKAVALRDAQRAKDAAAGKKAS